MQLKDTINILSITTDLGIGGTARQIITVDKYLNKDIFNHYIASVGSSDNVRKKDLDSSKVFCVENIVEIKDIIRKFNIDVVYCHRHGRNESIYDKIAEQFSHSVVLVELNTFSVKDNGIFGRRIDKQIFVSKTNVVKFCKQNNLQFDCNRHKVVHALVDCNNFLNNQPTSREIYDYKNKLDLNGFFVVGRIARPVMDKWDDKTVIFWKKICTKNPRVKFVIYGVPEERKKYLINSGIQDNLIICNPTSNDKQLSLFYSSIDALIQFSPIGECSCATIAEAMLFKKPIIVTSTPFPHFVGKRVHTKDNGQIEQIENGVNGYVVKSATAAASAINFLANNPTKSREFGLRNNQEVLNKYDASIGIKTLESIFIEGVKAKRGVLSQKIEDYFNNLIIYPDKTMIENWFKEYYDRLSNVYGQNYHDNILDWGFYTKNSLIRKFKTFLKFFNL